MPLFEHPPSEDHDRRRAPGTSTGDCVAGRSGYTDIVPVFEGVGVVVDLTPFIRSSGVFGTGAPPSTLKSPTKWQACTTRIRAHVTRYEKRADAAGSVCVCGVCGVS